MTPIVAREANSCYLGPNFEIADLPCRREGADTYSVWQPSPPERELLANGAHLRLGVYGAVPIPPMSLQVVPNVGPYQRLDLRCDTCDRVPEDPVHGAGPGTHAFRLRRPLDPEVVKEAKPSEPELEPCAVLLDRDELGAVMASLKTMVRSVSGESPYFDAAQRVIDRLEPVATAIREAGRASR